MKLSATQRAFAPSRKCPSLFAATLTAMPFYSIRLKRCATLSRKKKEIKAMSKTKTSPPKPTPPTVITVTLPDSEEEPHSGTLIVARGELAHIRQFTYGSLSDLTA